MKKAFAGIFVALMIIWHHCSGLPNYGGVAACERVLGINNLTALGLRIKGYSIFGKPSSLTHFIFDVDDNGIQLLSNELTNKLFKTLGPGGGGGFEMDGETVLSYENGQRWENGNTSVFHDITNKEVHVIRMPR